MSIFRGTGGSGNSTDDSIVSAVTEQAGIATTKAGEAATSASNANTSATNAATSATTASTKATEAASSATTASTKATEANTAKTGAEAAKTAAEAARDTALVHANTANNTHVQTVSGIATEVQNLDSIKTDITGVNTIKSDVTTVAGISSNVTTVAADASDIGTVATNITNVNNVGDNISNVNSVAGNATNINTVAGDASDIGTVSSNISNVNTVAGISSDVTTVAGLESKMDTVIADASDIGAVANNIDDVTTVAGINSEVDTVAGISAKVTTVADNIADVQNADTNAANASASASQAANSATAASASATTASTKATEASNSATAASNSASTATTKATEAAGSATTATTKATEASTSATNAATSATTATTKASEAASSATAASGSATTATTKAAEADASATSAASSATDSSNAASTWTNYYSTYLGAADAPPTADVQGNALQTGAFYYDTGAGSNTVGLYVYNGSSWVYSTNYNNVTAPYSLAQHLSTNGKNICFGDNDKAKFGASDDLEIWHDGTASRIKDSGTGDLRIQGSTRVRIENADGADMIFANSGGSVDLYHNGSKKVCTTATGVDVTGTVTADGFSLGNTEYFLAGSGSQLKIGYDGTDNIIRSQGPSLYIDANNHIFRGYSPYTERMRIDSSGKVGIGTSSPTTSLDVNGTIAADNAIFGTTSDAQTIVYVTSSTTGESEIRLGDTDTDAGSIAYNNADNSMQFRANAAERMRIDSSGKVGIGTTSPDSLLEVVGADPILTVRDTETGLASTNATLRLAESGGGDSLGNYWDINYTSNNALRVLSNTTERMRIDSSGNVGIGTSSPNRPLTVESSDVGLAEFESTNSISKVYFKDSGTTNAYSVAVGSVGNEMAFYASSGGAERMRIDSSGKVGIGTSSPSYPLTVYGSNPDSEIVASFGSQNNVNEYTAIGLSGFIAGNDATKAGIALKRVGTFGTGELHFLNNNTLNDSDMTLSDSKMMIDSSGNVGIGTTSPSQALDVDGNVSIGTDSSAYIDLERASANYIRANNSGTGRLHLTAGTDLRFHTGQADGDFSQNERMRIDSSGNLLVGKTSTGVTTQGIEARADGLLAVTRDGAYTALFNRETSDGDIVHFRKDNTTVGSIGSAFGNRLFIGNGDTAVRFAGDLDTIVPWNGSTNALRDASIDLGEATGRFKDLYLSGGVHLGGTTAANKLDDYEEGGFTPSFTFANGNTDMVVGSVHGAYTKVGRMVVCNIRGSITTLGSSTGNLHLTGLPFTVGDTLNTTGLESVGTVSFVSNVTTETNNLGLIPSQSDTYARFTYTNSSYETGYLNQTTIANGFDFRATLTYFTA